MAPAHALAWCRGVRNLNPTSRLTRASEADGGAELGHALPVVQATAHRQAARSTERSMTEAEKVKSKQRGADHEDDCVRPTRLVGPGGFRRDCKRRTLRI